MSTNNPSEVTQAIVNSLKLMTNPSFKEVYYGEESMIPKTPAADIEFSMESEYAGAPFQLLHTFSGIINIHHGAFKDRRLSKRECNEAAEKVRDHLHLDYNLGGLLIHGFVSGMELGVTVMEETALWTTRLTYTGVSKTNG